MKARLREGRRAKKKRGQVGMKVGKTYEAGMARQVLGVGINDEIEKIHGQGQSVTKSQGRAGQVGMRVFVKKKTP